MLGTRLLDGISGMAYTLLPAICGRSASPCRSDAEQKNKTASRKPASHIVVAPARGLAVLEDGRREPPIGPIGPVCRYATVGSTPSRRGTFGAWPTSWRLWIAIQAYEIVGRPAAAEPLERDG